MPRDRDSSTEETPLVGGARTGRGLHPVRARANSVVSAISSVVPTVPTVRNPQLVLALFCAVILFGASAGGIWSIPAVRIVEDIVCRQYFHVSQGDDIDEAECKADAVQTRVAYIFAVYFTIQSILSKLID